MKFVFSFRKLIFSELRKQKWIYIQIKWCLYGSVYNIRWKLTQTSCIDINESDVYLDENTPIKIYYLVQPLMSSNYLTSSYEGWQTDKCKYHIVNINDVIEIIAQENKITWTFLWLYDLRDKKQLNIKDLFLI